jgi:hypothetical protein
MKEVKEKIDLIFSDLKNECITEKMAHQSIMGEILKVEHIIEKSLRNLMCYAFDNELDKSFKFVISDLRKLLNGDL